jgi:hypothetical protein
VLDRGLTFDRFLVGRRNELAAAAARRVAESPGFVYNPLLIRGGSGLGKTHLLHAISQYASQIQPDLAIRLETSEQFADRVTGAIVNIRQAQPHNLLAGIDFLLIDELERISGMDRTQQELASIGTKMVEERRQLVLASVMAPADLPNLIPDLRALLEQATVVDIDPPDAAMRRALTQRIAVDLNVILSPDVVRALADFDLYDGRLLRSAVERLIAIELDEGRACVPGDVYRVVPETVAPRHEGGEFDNFLDDISKTLAVVVETAPWRRRIGEAILRWGGEGIRTTRLDEALQADAPPDVDSLLESFGRDAERLIRIRAELAEIGIEEILDDPGDVDRAEDLLARASGGRSGPTAAAGGKSSSHGEARKESDDHPADPWFLNPAKVVLDWPDLEGRLIEDPR